MENLTHKHRVELHEGLQGGHMHLGGNRYDQMQASHAVGPESFGVRVQVQGIEGRPYVVLNGQGRPSQHPGYPDVFYMDQPYQEYVSTMNGRGSSVPGPVMDERLMRHMHTASPEVPVSTKNPGSPLLNYQRHPELLRPYDPRNNSLDLQGLHHHPNNNANKMVDSDLNQCSTNSSPVYASHVMVKRARIPVPGTGRERAQEHIDSGRSSSESVPCRPSHIICRLSVPDHGSDHHRSSQRMGRARHRNQLGPEEKRRSQSVGASSSGDSSRTSPAPGGVRGMGEGVGAGLDSAQHDTLPRMKKKDSMCEDDIRSLTAAQLEEQQKEMVKPSKLGRVIYRMERRNFSKSVQQNGDHSSPEREAQATPDILKGQRELLEQPDEDATKLVLFNYLKEGNGEGDEIIRQKVNLLFEKIQMLRSCAVQNVEELSDSVTEVKELQDRRAALESEVIQLKQQLEEEIKNRESLSEASEKSTEELKKLQEKLSRSEQEQVSLRQRLTDMEKELQVSLEKLLQMKREREQSRAEAKGLQQQLSDMHDELDSTKSTEQGERDAILRELANMRMEFQELQQLQEEQEELLRWKERELTALKGVLEEEISAHTKDVETLKQQHKEEVQKLLKAKDEGMAALGQEKSQVEAERGESRAQVKELTLAKELLLSQVHSLEIQITTLNNIIQQEKNQESQLRECLDKLMEEKQRLEEEFSEVRQQEEDMCGANRALTRHLEDTQSELTKLNSEHRQLKERLKEETRQVEELRKSKRGLEEERKKQDRVFEKLQEEMNALLMGSERETQRLQDQVDEAREQSLKELSVLRTQLHNTQTELEKHTHASQECQKELCQLETELSQREGKLEQAELKCKQLEKRVEELQEISKTTQDDRDRQVKFMEERVAQLQEALAEERSSGDSLMQRMERVREQTGRTWVEQVRGELLQERAQRQDLECDKISLERQNKDLKSRVSHIEGSQRSGQEGLVSKLELRIQELEERLLEEERDNNTLQQANRKLERKMKEMTMQVNDEQLSLQNQRDQLTLRLKTLKRQLDEAEEEIERLEHSKKKLQRELDEQQEINDHLQSQLTALHTELRRKKKPVLKSLDDEDEEDDEENESSG
ncbi:cingulin-like protein 1 isoform X1 [Pygocentrus nattereri]|uniref:cingulin-like protein 1 isoform X1 n=1 Tax=Pygocentrus nattereri TaxID=42514 RepID=UPI001891183F|nr:cingulin-like protein 1 isoform X1 [Pygocentrus nattereri]